MIINNAKSYLIVFTIDFSSYILALAENLYKKAREKCS